MLHVRYLICLLIKDASHRLGHTVMNQVTAGDRRAGHGTTADTLLCSGYL